MTDEEFIIEALETYMEHWFLGHDEWIEKWLDVVLVTTMNGKPDTVTPTPELMAVLR